MAAVHFGTIPCGLYTACKEKSQIFSNICIRGNDIIYLKLASLFGAKLIEAVTVNYRYTLCGITM